jgi:hypothetical protein
VTLDQDYPAPNSDGRKLELTWEYTGYSQFKYYGFDDANSAMNKLTGYSAQAVYRSTTIAQTGTPTVSTMRVYKAIDTVLTLPPPVVSFAPINEAEVSTYSFEID